MCEISIKFLLRFAHDIRTQQLKDPDFEKIIKNLKIQLTRTMQNELIVVICYLKEFYTDPHYDLTPKKLIESFQSMKT